jgi:PAS domain S-box-containing protein
MTPASGKIPDAEQLYRLVVEAAPDAMILVAGDDRITLVNSRTEQLFGYERSSLLGQPFEMLVPERCRSNLRALLGRFPAAPAAPAIGPGRELFGLRQDGVEVPIEIGLNPIHTGEGDFVVSIGDITERRKTEDRSQLFRSLVEGVRDYEILLLNPAGFVMTWNEGSARIKGYSADEIIGKHFSCFYAQEDIDAGRPVVELEMARLHGKYTEEGRRLRRDGSGFWAAVTVTSLLNGDGSLRGFLKITRDITTRRVAETALRESERELRLLADAMPQIVWTARGDGYIDYYNRRWYEFTGFHEGDGGDESWTPILHPDDVSDTSTPGTTQSRRAASSKPKAGSATGAPVSGDGIWAARCLCATNEAKP